MNENIETTLKLIAKDLGVKSQAFSMWKARKRIPHKHQIRIVQKSEELGTPLTFEQLKNPF